MSWAASDRQLRKFSPMKGYSVKLVRHGIHDEYSLIAPPTHLYAYYRLDAAGIEEIARSALGKI